MIITATSTKDFKTLKIKEKQTSPEVFWKIAQLKVSKNSEENIRDRLFNILIDQLKLLVDNRDKEFRC